MIPTVSICIPSIAERSTLLVRAVASAMRQTHPVSAIHVSVDLDRSLQAWGNRNRTMAAVDTEWLGFLDDDDELYPHHCETLLALAAESGAGLVWGWFDVSGGHDPFPAHWRGKNYDPDEPHTVPITYLVRTAVAREAMERMGGFVADDERTGAWDVQDKPFFDMCARIGGTAATPVATWRWHHNQRNTSGLAQSNAERRLAIVGERGPEEFPRVAEEAAR